MNFYDLVFVQEGVIMNKNNVVGQFSRNLTSRALRFERLESRELLDAAPLIQALEGVVYRFISDGLGY